MGRGQYFIQNNLRNDQSIRKFQFETKKGVEQKWHIQQCREKDKRYLNRRNEQQSLQLLPTWRQWIKHSFDYYLLQCIFTKINYFYIIQMLII